MLEIIRGFRKVGKYYYIPRNNKELEDWANAHYFKVGPRKWVQKNSPADIARLMSWFGGREKAIIIGSGKSLDDLKIETLEQRYGVGCKDVTVLSLNFTTTYLEENFNIKNLIHCQQDNNKYIPPPCKSTTKCYVTPSAAVQIPDKDIVFSFLDTFTVAAAVNACIEGGVKEIDAYCFDANTVGDTRHAECLNHCNAEIKAPSTISKHRDKVNELFPNIAINWIMPIVPPAPSSDIPVQ